MAFPLIHAILDNITKIHIINIIVNHVYFAMNYQKISQLNKNKPVSSADIANIFKIKRSSAKVLCCRYVKQGILVRLKRDIYMLDQAWEHISQDQSFKIANMLQVPSYVSFTTALAFYNTTTQIPRRFIESASVKRSLRMEIKDDVFVYFKLNKKLYFEFEKKNDCFIATPEKAIVDSLYLQTLGKYKLDLSALNIARLDRKQMLKISRQFPVRTQEAVKKLCKI